jgi:hypothetical protein
MSQALKLISGNARLYRDQSVKALIVGPAGIGKTSLLRTLNTSRALFVDLEAGDLAVQDLEVDTLRPRTWDECRDLAVFLGGPDPALPMSASYSFAHYKAVSEAMKDAGTLTKYETIFIDSITVASRLCFKWCQQQPVALSDRGRKDLRAIYGLLAREMLNWLTHLQHIRHKHVLFVGLLEQQRDDFNTSTWQVQLEGAKTVRELPGIVDLIVTMNYVDFGDSTLTRAFICTQPNPWDYPAKDRSGRLAQIEEPHLGKLLAKAAPTTNDSLDTAVGKPASQHREEGHVA